MKMYLIVGMIASGKSTFCKNAAKQGFIIVNDDSVVNLVHADDYTLYDKSLKILYKSIENQIASLGMCLGRNVLVDRGLNISKHGRKRWIALANSFDVPCEALVLPNEGVDVHATRRFKSDSRGHTYEYWFNVAQRHSEIYCEPNLDEGFDKIHHITHLDEILDSGFSKIQYLDKIKE